MSRVRLTAHLAIPPDGDPEVIGALEDTASAIKADISATHEAPADSYSLTIHAVPVPDEKGE